MKLFYFATPVATGVSMLMSNKHVNNKLHELARERAVTQKKLDDLGKKIDDFDAIPGNLAYWNTPYCSEWKQTQEKLADIKTEEERLTDLQKWLPFLRNFNK